MVVGHYQGAALEPLVLILDYDGHAFLGVVDLGHEGVGFGGDDGIGTQGLAGHGVCPIGKEPCKGEEALARQFE